MANRTGESAPIVRIFLSSPCDVEDERKIARELIEGQLQKSVAHRHLKLEVIVWDDPNARIPMLANETPQESVTNARPRPSSCDIVIVMLWARMGTPLPETIRKPDGGRYLSGTEWEYWDAINSTRKPKPEVLVYRRTEEPLIPARDRKRAAEIWEQLDQVDAFFAPFTNPDGSLAGSVNPYPTPNTFRDLLQQHLADLLHRRFPAGPGSGEPQPVAATIPPAYIEWLQRECADVSLLGQDIRSSHAITIDQIYVPTIVRLLREAFLTIETGQKIGVGTGNNDRTTKPLCVVTENEDVSKTLRELFIGSAGQRTTTLVTLLECLGMTSLYVPAPAGAGKSTFCRWAVLQSIAAANLAHPVPAPKEFAETVPADLRGRLPLLVPLRDFHGYIDCGRGRRAGHRQDLEEALVAWVDRSLTDRLTGDNLLAHLKAGSAFLLLDGLDEVPVSDTRNGAEVYPCDVLLGGLADALPFWLNVGNRVLLTSRPYGLDEEGLRKLGLPQAPLEPLPEALQDLFIARWFHALGKPEQSGKLIATIRDAEREYLAQLAENPMMLTALCVLWDSGGRLPEDRYELYRRIVGNVLFHRFRDEIREREPVRARLEAVALGMHVGDRDDPRDSPSAEISYLEIDHILRAFAADDPYKEHGAVGPVARREELLARSGLLLPRAGDRAAFCHLSIQEFLAAERILRTEDDLLPVFRARSAVAQWRPTLIFLFAGKIVGKTPRWGTALLARLITEQHRAAVKRNPAPAVFIAEALDLCLAKNYAVPEELKESFRRLALDAIEDEMELQARHALGLTLGRIGDPRIFDARDPRAYDEVPAGTYPYGGEGRMVEIARSFWIGHYPVTNQQYAAFIAAEGYAERKWWSDAGWAWLEEEKITGPEMWYSRRWNAPNQPVVGVSFWEAEAFCAWAGGRLPTEEEWEAAARGEEGPEYPWGNDWEDGICNTGEAGLGVTSPVGLFPRSVQWIRWRIEDLAGNVWEWCNSLHDPANKENPQARRVLGGGSWSSDRDGARSADRRGDYPFDRYDDVGFRVVCLSPICGH